MTDQPTSYTAEPLDSATPDDGAEVASLEWLLTFTDRHVMQVTPDEECPVMAAAWALGFAGASRLEVWWVLRDERLRRAYGQIIRALTRVRPPQEPLWTDLVTTMDMASRAGVLEQIARVRSSATPGRVPESENALYEICHGHPDAVVSPDRRYVAVPSDALDALAVAARSVTPEHVTSLLAQARGPFTARLDEAARVNGDAVTTFHARRRGRRVA